MFMTIHSRIVRYPDFPRMKL